MFGRQDDDNATDQAHNETPGQPPANDWQHPGAPPSGDQGSAPEVSQPPAAPEETVVSPDQHSDFSAPEPGSEPEADAPAADASPAAHNDELIDIKRQALGELTPLVGHLDQSPEEKFRTTMMMIQASDDQSLVKVAYQAAQQIQEEKARAQALLDIINEINYFTQPKN